MAQAQNGDTVRVDYTGTLPDGTVFDTSDGRDPIEFTLGEDEVLPGVDQALHGMEPGDEKTVTIPANEAFGSTQPELVAEVDRAQLPEDMELQVGQQLQVLLPDGRPILVTIREIKPDTVTLDANHPLAGQDLTFKLKLVDIVPKDQQQAA